MPLKEFHDCFVLILHIYRSRFPIVRDDVLHPFCIRTGAGCAIVGAIVRKNLSRVETMTIHICFGNDPNNGKGVGNYQLQKNDIGLEVVFFSSKNDQEVF